MGRPRVRAADHVLTVLELRCLCSEAGPEHVARPAIDCDRDDGLYLNSGHAVLSPS